MKTLAPLIPCPKCGGQAERHNFADHKLWCIRCTKCGAVGKRADKMSVATKLWNNRNIDENPKEVHFYTNTDRGEDGFVCVSTWCQTILWIGRYNLVHTTQMGLLDTGLLLAGFRIFVHDKDGRYEIRLGDGNERTTREIRAEHRLFKMWTNGEFDL